LTETLQEYVLAASNFHKWLNATETDLKRSEMSMEILSHQQMKGEMDRLQVRCSEELLLFTSSVQASKIRLVA
jgi:hypothetical protein